MAGRRLALLIATSSYDDAAFGRLRAPDADIEALRDVLADPTVGGYAVDVLSNAASHEVNQAIEEFFAEAKLDDLVLLYFSGHGFKNDAGRLYLITRESRQRRLDSTAVSAQFVRDQLDRCRSRRKVVILDCCYAGAFPPGATRGAEHVDVLGGLSGRGCAVITASSALEYAFEADGNSSPVSQAQPSVFTGALIDGLATGSADIDGDGLIDIDELYDHVYKRVKSVVPQQTPGQSSQLEGSLYVATSPRGPRPTALPLEFMEAIKSPFMRLRLGVVGELLEFCAGAHPGKLMAVQGALSELAEDDSVKVSEAAKSALESIGERLAGLAHAVARARGDVVEAHLPSEAARSEAAKIIDDARREADQLLSAAGLDVARLRMNAERDRAAMIDTAKKERDELLAAASRQAEEMRAKALWLLEESEAQIAQAEAESKSRLATQPTEDELAANALAESALAESDRAERDSDSITPELVALAGKKVEEIRRQMAESPPMTAAAYEQLRAQHRELLGEYFKLKTGRPDQDGNRPRGLLKTPEFTRVMRGFDPVQVDEFLRQFALNPRLGAPEFSVVMRGYAKGEVLAHIRVLQARALQGEL